VDKESRDALAKVSMEQLQNSYKSGAISAGRYNELLHAKSRIMVEDANLENPADYVKMMWQQSVKHFQDGWDNVVEAATRDPAKDTLVLSDLYYSGLAAWGMFTMGMAPLTAFGEVNGEGARRLAIGAGASPGAARYIGLAVDLASGFVPAGKIAQSATKGVQGYAKTGLLGKTMKELAAKAAEMKQLELSFGGLEVGKALSETIKPGMSKEAALMATLEKLQAEGHQIDAAAKKFVEKNVEGWFHLQPSQAELPFRVMSESLAGEGAQLSHLLETVVQATPVSEKVAKVADAARRGANQFALDIAHYAKGTTIEQAKKELPQLAERMGINMDDLKNIVPGGRFDPKNSWYENPKKMYGYLKALEDRASEIGPLAKAALEGDDVAKMQFARYMTGLFTNSPEGPIAYSKGFTNMIMHWDPENMAKGDIAAAVGTFAKDMVHMADSGGGFGKMIFNSQGAFTVDGIEKGWAKIRNIYLNTLLPFSFKAAALGNTYTTGAAVMERAIGALFSTSQHGYTNKEALYMVKGLSLAMSDGVKAFGDAYRMMPQGVGRFAHQNPWNSQIGQIINIPMNTVKGMDNFFSAIITRASHYAVAAREGENVFNLSGAALGNFIRQRVANPTAEMLKEAHELAMTSTFQNQLGGFMGGFQRVLQWGPGSLYFPFVKTGVNLGKYVWDRTPGLQLISKQLYMDMAAGGAKADAAVARIVMGQLLGNMYMEMAKNGDITGGGPVDPQVRKSWLTTHQPYSARSGTGWVPLSNMEPANTLPGMIADLTEVINSLDPLTAEQAAMAVGFAGMRNFTNGTWWQNASNLQDVLQTVTAGGDLSVAAYRFLRSPISAPFQGMAPIARANDPIARQARSYIDDIRNKVPGWSKTQPPLRDGVGDPVVPPIAFGGSWFGLMRPIVPAFRPFEQDPLKKELARLGVKIPIMTDHLGGKLHEGFDLKTPRPEDKFGIRLSNEDLDLRQQIYRRIVRHPEYGVEAFMNNPDVDYKTMPDPLRRSELERMLGQAWKNSGDALMAQKPELQQRVLESDARSILAKTPDPDKEEITTTLAGAINDIMDATPEEQENLAKFGIIGPKVPDNVTYGTPYGPLIHAYPGGLATGEPK